MTRPIIGRLRVSTSFDALRHAPFRRYWWTQGFSLIGSWMQVTAQSWLVFDLIPDPAEAAVGFGYIGAVQFAPVLVLGLFAGVLIDARSRRQVLLFSQGTLALSAGALALLAYFGTLSYAWLLGLAVLNGIANTFDVPTRQALIKDLVPAADVRNAVALNALIFNLARLVGPSVAAGAIAFFGVHFGEEAHALLKYVPAFAANAVSYVIIIGAILTLPLPPREIVPHRILAEIKEGLRYTFKTPEVRIATLLVGALSLTIVNFQLVVPLFARQALQIEIQGLGVLFASLGIGAIIAFVVNGSFPDEDRLMLMRRGVLFLALSFIALTLSPNIYLASLALMCCGLGMILTMVNAQATVQLMVPDLLRGRVMSIYMLVFSGVVPFGALLVSQLVGRFEARQGLLAVGLIGLALTLSLRPHRADLRRAQQRTLQMSEAGTD